MQRKDPKKLFYRSDKKNAKYVYDICVFKKFLGSEACKWLLFVHAFSGSDSTSRIYSVNNSKSFKNVVKGNFLICQCAKIFTTPRVDVDTVVDMGS